MAGRIPALNRSADKNICPSVMEITLVGIYAETSHDWVSTIGKAVILPSPKGELDLAALSKRRECK